MPPIDELFNSGQTQRDDFRSFFTVNFEITITKTWIQNKGIKKCIDFKEFPFGSPQKTRLYKLQYQQYHVIEISQWECVVYVSGKKSEILI